MALPQGLNFRASSGYVTDGSNDFCMSNGSPIIYPTTSTQGNTVGYESPTNVQMRDRTTSNDPRLAGMHFHSSGLVQTVRIDLPSSGDYKVRLAVGDEAQGWDVKAELFDNTTSLGILANGATGAPNRFIDATNIIYTAASWPANNTLVTKTFTSTICRIKYGNGSSLSPIAHFYIESVGGSGPTIYTITPSGTVSFTGNAVEVKTKVINVIGNITYQGSSKLIKTNIILPTGNLNFNGTALINYTYVQNPSGTLSFTGTAPLYVPGSYIPSTSLLLTGVGK